MNTDAIASLRHQCIRPDVNQHIFYNILIQIIEDYIMQEHTIHPHFCYALSGNTVLHWVAHGCSIHGETMNEFRR